MTKGLWHGDSQGHDDNPPPAILFWIGVGLFILLVIVLALGDNQ